MGLSKCVLGLAQAAPGRMGKVTGDLRDVLGENADRLIREAHGMKCRNCEEVIGELTSLVQGKNQSFGWVHLPNGDSYLFCDYPTSKSGTGNRDFSKKAEPAA